MLFTVALVVILATANVHGIPEEMRELAEMLHNTCRDKSGVSEDVLDRAINKLEMVDDPNFKCYLKCLMTEMAVMDEAGNIDTEAAISVLPDDIKDKLEPTFRLCETKVTKADDACETAYISYKCVHDNNLEYYMII
nr:odorant-binding protein [Lasioderma serricorne]